jgi:Isochorismatase family
MADIHAARAAGDPCQSRRGPGRSGESTARAANERGYELTIVTDAITDTDEGAHLNSLTAIFPQIAELATAEEVLTALDRVRPRHGHSLGNRS